MDGLIGGRFSESIDGEIDTFFLVVLLRKR
jgi:hypothetical protein